jgi:hypothetical protein
VRELATEFGQHFGIEPIFLPELEGSTSLLNNAARAGTLFGHPTATPAEMIGWIADWIRQGGVMLNKPTHFQTRDGKF